MLVRLKNRVKFNKKYYAAGEHEFEDQIASALIEQGVAEEAHPLVEPDLEDTILTKNRPYTMYDYQTMNRTQLRSIVASKGIRTDRTVTVKQLLKILQEDIYNGGNG